MFTMPGGGRIRFRPLENLVDAAKYQGQNLTDAAVEEAGNYEDSKPIDTLFGALRSAHGVPTQLILTFNPGGVGHGWLKDRYWKPAPCGMVPLVRKLANGAEHRYVFIPSKVQNNAILLKNDPDYINRLHLVGSPELVRAWLEGDFNIHEGTYFPEFGQRHILPPFTIPSHWRHRYGGFDWGYNSPFCYLWAAVSSGKDDSGREMYINGIHIPKGALVFYRELWGKGIDNSEIAEKIVQMSAGDKPITWADPSIWNHQGGPSINDQFSAVFAKHGFPAFKPADNDRISGWGQIRRRLHPKPAMMFITTACPYLIETLPGLAMDPKYPEDVDTSGNDHAPDAARYLCKGRVIESEYSEKSEPVRHGVVKVQDYVRQVRREQKRLRV